MIADSSVLALGQRGSLCSNSVETLGFDVDIEETDEDLETETLFPPKKKISIQQLQCKPAQKPVPQNTIIENQLEKYDQDLIDKSRNVIKNREHAFRSLWERNNFMPIDPNAQFDPAVPYSTSRNWKQWPPPIPQLPEGLKIPIEFFPHVEYDLPISGIPIEIDFGMEARPIAEIPEEVFNNLNGILNYPKSTFFNISPPSLLFVKAKIGQKHAALLKLRNDGPIPRRICVVRPSNKVFDVIWGAELNEKVMIPPGLTTKIWVHFNPISEEDHVNDILTVIIHGDGNIVVPMMVASSFPPILEMEEWDCGCSIIGRARLSQFEISNLSGPGRFWILTEIGYTQQHLVFNKPKKSKQSPEEEEEEENEEDENEDESKLEVEGGKDETSEVKDEDENEDEENEDEEVNLAQKKKLKGSQFEKMDQIHIKPFTIYPACFRLQKNQKINVKAMYRPTDTNFHYEKLAILCDNGEVRWICIKGNGIDQKTQKLIELKGDWTGPPCDLPTDLSTKLILDCGNLIAGEYANPNFKIINESCIPLHYFWSIRPIMTSEGCTLANPLKSNGLQHFTEEPTAWQEFDENDEDDLKTLSEKLFKIFPAQGILDSKDEINCEIKVQCPVDLGYHACVISLFVQQVSTETRPILVRMITDLNKKNLNQIPIHYEKLVENMAEEYRTELPNENEPARDNFIHKSKYRNSRMETFENGSILFLPTPMYHLPMKNGHVDHHHLNLAMLKFKKRTSHLSYHGFHFSVENELTRGSSKKAGRENLNLLKHGPEKNPDFKRKTNDLEYLIYPEKYADQERKSEGNRMEKKSLEQEIHKCISQYERENTKTWLNDDAAFKPNAEVEFWLRSIPFECWINPPFLVASGYAVSSLERKFAIHNQSEHPLTICWSPIINEIYSLLIDPEIFTVSPMHTFVFKIRVHLQRSGKVFHQISGTITLPFKTISCTIPLSLQIQGPSLEILTPLINFGIVALGAEKTMTFALKNSGSYKTKWRAKLSSDAMEKQILGGLSENREKEISPNGLERQMKINKMASVWPEWGVLEPDEVAGGQIFLTAETNGKLTMSIEITTDGNPNLCLFIPVYGEIQSQSLVLKHGRILIRDIFPSIPSDCSFVTLINPTAFLVPFSWQNPIGVQSEHCSVKFDPKFGVVLPKQSINCQMWILAEKQVVLSNLFIPCCVEGMKEPLLLQIEGQVSGLLVTFIMPCTKPPQLEQDDIYNSMFNERWSYIFRGNETQKLVSDMEKVVAGEGGHFESVGGEGDLDINWHKFQICDHEENGECYAESLGFKTTLGSITNIKGENVTGLDDFNKKSRKSGKRKGTQAIEDVDLKGKKKGKKKTMKTIKGKSSTKSNPQFVNVVKSEVDAQDGSEANPDQNNVETEQRKISNKSGTGKHGKKKISNNKASQDAKELNLQQIHGVMKPPAVDLGEDTGEHEEFIGEHEEFIGEHELQAAWLRLKQEKSQSFYSPLMAGKDSSFMDDISIKSDPITLIPPETAPNENIGFEGNRKKLIYFPVTRIGKIVEESFVIQNHSPVRAKFSIKAAKYNVDCWIGQRMNTIENLIARKMMSHSPLDVEGKIVSGKFGIAFEVVPKEGFLEPYALLNVKIRVHANLWGIYQDELLCQFEGIKEPYVVYLEALVTGCPVTFQLVPSPPILRFGKRAIGSPEIIRQIIMKNRAPCRITLSWHTLEFNQKVKKPVESALLREFISSASASTHPAPFPPPNTAEIATNWQNEQFPYPKEEYGGEVGGENDEHFDAPRKNYELVLDGDMYKVRPRQMSIPAGCQMEVSFVFAPEKGLQNAILTSNVLPSASFKGLALARLHLDKEFIQEVGPEMPLTPWMGLDAGIAATWIDVHASDSKMDIQDFNGILLFSSPVNVALPTCPRKTIGIEYQRNNRSYFDTKFREKIVLMTRHLTLENVSEASDISVELNVESPFLMTTERRQVSQRKIDSLIIFRQSQVRVIVDLKLTLKQIDDAISKVLGGIGPERYNEFFSTSEVKFQRVMWPGEKGYYCPSMDNSIVEHTTCVSIESLMQIIHPSGILQMVIMEGWLHLPQVIAIPRVVNFKSKFVKQNKSITIKLYNMTEDPLPIKITQFYTTISGLVKLANESNSLSSGFKAEYQEVILPPSRELIEVKDGNQHQFCQLIFNFCPKQLGIHRSFWLIQNLNEEEICVIETLGFGT